MQRKQFIKGLIGTSILVSMEGISILANAINLQKAQDAVPKDEIASFGAIHLNNTSLEKAIEFWTTIIGLQVRATSASTVEFGTAHQTLVVVHESATAGFQEGYSGLYHFAIHLPNTQALAKAIYRLQQHRYSFSPIDHTMTQSLYLTDYDGVMVELALETPERFKRVSTQGGLFMEDSQGVLHPASAPLDMNEILTHLVDKDLSMPIHADAKIGHIHFYAYDIETTNAFYTTIGFTQFNYFPQYKYADLGAGGIYQHRVAMNAWHGLNKPVAPAHHAGLKHYHIIFNSKEHLTNVLLTIKGIEEKDNSYWTKDPSGTILQLTYKS